MDRRVVISSSHPYFKPIVAASLILAVVLLAGCLFLVEHMFDEPVAVALVAARQSDRYQAAIGEPSRARFMTTGTLNERNGAGTADLAIPVQGPNGTGKLLEWAQEAGGKWHICSLTLKMTNGAANETIISDASTYCDRK